MVVEVKLEELEGRLGFVQEAAETLASLDEQLSEGQVGAARQWTGLHGEGHGMKAAKHSSPA